MVRKHKIPATEKTKGGPIQQGESYTVGEQGEERFYPIPRNVSDPIPQAKIIRVDAVPEKKG